MLFTSVVAWFLFENERIRPLSFLLLNLIFSLDKIEWSTFFRFFRFAKYNRENVSIEAKFPPSIENLSLASIGWIRWIINRHLEL